MRIPSEAIAQLGSGARATPTTMASADAPGTPARADSRGLPSASAEPGGQEGAQGPQQAPNAPADDVQAPSTPLAAPSSAAPSGPPRNVLGFFGKLAEATRELLADGELRR